MSIDLKKRSIIKNTAIAGAALAASSGVMAGNTSTEMPHTAGYKKSNGPGNCSNCSNQFETVCIVFDVPIASDKVCQSNYVASDPKQHAKDSIGFSSGMGKCMGCVHFGTSNHKNVGSCAQAKKLAMGAGSHTSVPVKSSDGCTIGFEAL